MLIQPGTDPSVVDAAPAQGVDFGHDVQVFEAPSPQTATGELATGPDDSTASPCQVFLKEELGGNMVASLRLASLMAMCESTGVMGGTRSWNGISIANNRDTDH